MSSTPSRPEPTDHANQCDEDAQYYRKVLHELIAIGTDLARSIHRQATPESNNQPKAEPNAEPGAAPEPAAAPAPDPTIAFDRIARTLRRTIAIARKLSEPARPAASERSSERRLSARKQIIRAVEDTIQRRTNGAEAEALHAEFYERLDDPDLDDDLDQQPVADIIKAICRDLGIEHHPGTHPWKRRRPADVRELCARAAASQTVQPRTPQPALAQPRTTQPRPPQPRTGDRHPIPALPPRTPTSTGPPGP